MLRKGALAVLGATLIAVPVVQTATVATAATTATAAEIQLNHQFWQWVCGSRLTARDLQDVRYSLRSWGGRAGTIAGWPDRELRYALNRGCDAYLRYGRVERANKALWGG